MSRTRRRTVCALTRKIDQRVIEVDVAGLNHADGDGGIFGQPEDNSAYGQLLELADVPSRECDPGSAASCVNKRILSALSLIDIIWM